MESKMRKVLVCNHKMFLTFDEAIQLEREMKDINHQNIDLIVCPSYINLNVFSSYNLGAQDAFYEDKGPYTGEVSAYDLSLLKVKYVIVGHYEKRNVDTNLIINKKIKSILNNSMTPILCVGESRMDKELMKTSEVIRKQLREGLKGINLEPYQEIIIAYEPNWVIGNNNCLKKDEILDTLRYIKKILNQNNIFNYKLLYGGSVNSKNIEKLLSNEIDGYLLGASSININELNYIIKSIK